MTNGVTRRAALTPTQWLICAVACLGFIFDTYETAVIPVVVRPAILELGGLHSGSPEFARWVGYLVFLPLIGAGVFGLLGGYLTDLLGRRRVLVWSILLYAGSSWAAAYATSLPMLLMFRFTTMAGVSVEWVAALAWLAELFPDPRRREAVLGYTQVSTALGIGLVASTYYFGATYGNRLPAIHGVHEAWRYALLAATVPALPLILVRPFLPESAMWRQQRALGPLSRPSIAELFRSSLRRTTLICGLLVACSYAVLFGATQHMSRIIPEIASMEHASRVQQDQMIAEAEYVNMFANMIARIIITWLMVRIVQRRRLLRGLVGAGTVVVPLAFLLLVPQGGALLLVAVFICIAIAAAQLNFWGNYLPRVYPTHIRGTGEGFALNVGGRMVGGSTAVVTAQLATVLPIAPASRLIYSAALVGGAVQLIALYVSRWMPEPAQEQLPA